MKYKYFEKCLVMGYRNYKSNGNNDIFSCWIFSFLFSFLASELKQKHTLDKFPSLTIIYKRHFHNHKNTYSEPYKCVLLHLWLLLLWLTWNYLWLLYMKCNHVYMISNMVTMDRLLKGKRREISECSCRKWYHFSWWNEGKLSLYTRDTKGTW